MEQFVLDYLSKVEGFKTRIKEVHWEEGTISGHELAGDVEEELQEFEDSIAEDMQGVYGVDINTNELEPVKSSSDTLKGLIEEIINGTVDFYKKLDGDKFIGARSETEAFLHTMNVKKYLARKTTKDKTEEKPEESSEEKTEEMNESVKINNELIKSVLEECTKNGNKLDKNSIRGIVSEVLKRSGYFK